MASAMIQVATFSFCTSPIKMEVTITEWFLQVQCPTVLVVTECEWFLQVQCPTVLITNQQKHI
jgi:dethiobiotin synthetase